MYRKIPEALKEYCTLLKQGATVKDKLVILLYFLKTPLHFILKKMGIGYSHTLLTGVNIKSEGNLFFCGDNIFSVRTAADSEKILKKYFKLREGIFVDIGAHIGKFTIMMANRLGSKGKVISIEPHPKNFKILEENISLNELKNVVPLNVACSDEEGKTELYLDKIGTGAHSIEPKRHKYDKKHFKGKIEVDTKKLDRILEEENVKKVGLIKIDVEGAEAKALKGAINILGKSHPRIIFEAHNEKNLGRVKKILDDFNYKIEKIDWENYFAY